MNKPLPRVVVVANDPTASSSINLLIGDICRIECYGRNSILCDEIALSPTPALVLVSFDALAPDPQGVGWRIREGFPAEAIPTLYVLEAGDVSCDDGFPLAACLVTLSRPMEFRAVIESRLGRRSSFFKE